MKNKTLNLITTQNHSLNQFKLRKESDNDFTMEMAKKILAEFMLFRRIPKSAESCNNIHCSKCALPHLPKVLAAVKKNTPVTFVLPAFPGKSPNPEKVLGHIPDHAERVALHFLGTLCQKIKNFYQPGIKIILCSDGRVFSDVVGMMESNVSDYQIELGKLIKELSLSDLSTFNLDDFYEGFSFMQMRDELMKTYGQSLEFLKYKIRNGAQASANPEEQEATSVSLPR